MEERSRGSSEVTMEHCLTSNHWGSLEQRKVISILKILKLVFEDSVTMFSKITKPIQIPTTLTNNIQYNSLRDRIIF